MEINSYQNNYIKSIDTSLPEKEKQSAALNANAENQQTIDFPTVDAALMRAYSGVANDVVSKDEVFEYLRNAGIKNEAMFDGVADSMCNSDGMITRQAFTFLKTLLPKSNIFHVRDYFLKSKDENGINFKALAVLNAVLKKPSPVGMQFYYTNVLSDLKDKNGNFNDNVLNIVYKNAEDFQKAYSRNQTIPVRFFRSLKDQNGMFDSKLVAFAKKELDGSKAFYKLTDAINEAKDENGSFSYEKYQINDKINSLFDKYTLNCVKDIYTEIAKVDKESALKFIDFADSIQKDSYFKELLYFIKSAKSEKDSNVGLDYNKESVDFLKKFDTLFDYKKEILLNALNGINKPFNEYSEEEVKRLSEFVLNMQDTEIASAIIDTAKIKTGKDSGRVDYDNIEKARFINNKTLNSLLKDAENGEVIKELAKALSKEEDTKALDVVHQLYSLEFKDEDQSSYLLYSDPFGFKSRIGTSVIRTISKYLSETDENGNPKHKIDSAKLEELKKLIPQKVSEDLKNKTQSDLFFTALDLPTVQDCARSINIDIDDICLSVLKDRSGEEIKAFRDFVKNTFDSTSGIFFVDKNQNIKSRIEISTGNALNPRKIIYDLKLKKPISETTETWNNGIQINTTADYLNGTTIEQRFETVKLNDLPYKKLISQTLKKYDEKGNLVLTEIVEKADIENVFNITNVSADGEIEYSSKAIKTKQGTDVIEKKMTSLDGTKSYYRYEDDPEGNRILDYKIIDENGKILLDQSVTFEVLGENHFLSARNGKSFDIKFNDNTLVVTNEQTGQKAEFFLSGFTKGTQNKIIPLLKQIPGDELFSMKELDLKTLTNDNNIENAQYSAKSIKTSDDFNELAVILHEWGHGKDDLMFDEIREKINNDPKLNEIYNYERDLFRKNLSDAQMSLISYFTSDHHYLGENKAVREGIAETNTILNVSPKNSTQSIRSHYWQQYFPKTIAYLAGFLN